MSARREITRKHAAEYRRASKKAKGVMLDQLVATTGWSRANAPRALTAAVKRKKSAKAVKRKPRARTYGYETTVELQLLNELYSLVRVRLNMFTATTKAAELAHLFETTNPAELTRQITSIQTRLISLAKDKTEAITVRGSRAKTSEARDHLSRAS